MIEHVTLTVSAATVGTPIGITTLFGALIPGPALWTLRVAAHFGLNAVATVAAALAVVVVASFSRQGVVRDRRSQYRLR